MSPTATATSTTPDTPSPGAIKALDGTSVHRISSGQVVVDLQTGVKELLENSLDAGATNIEVRFKDYGLQSFEVIDNGSGITPEDYDAIALKHYTSKLSSFTDLSTLTSFGFRGEALSSLCALSERVVITTATAQDAPMGTVLEFDRAGRLVRRDGKAARQRGTTVTVAGLFTPLPVRRKELERNAKREFGKALVLLSAYALVPCAQENHGVRLSVTNQPAGGRRTVQLRTDGQASTRASVSTLWGPRALENLVDLDVRFRVLPERAVLRRRGVLDGDDDTHANEVRVRGLVSKFAVGCGRAGTDRQFFFVNGRPCNPSKVQKAFNEVYRSFNATQAPFVVADFILPTDSCDINVSPDKRTILLHSEANLVQALKTALEETFAPARATYDVASSAVKAPDASIPTPKSKASKEPLFLNDKIESGNAVHDEDSATGRDVIAEIVPGEPPATRRRPEEESKDSGEPSLPAEDHSVAPTPETPGTSADAQEPPAGELNADSWQAAQGAHMIAGVPLARAAAGGRPAPIPQEIEIGKQAFEADPGTDGDVSLAPGPSGGPAAAATSTHRPPYTKRPVPCALARPGERSEGSAQTTLGILGEAWDLRRRGEGTIGPPSKKRRVDGENGLSGLAVQGAKQGRAAQQDMRERLRGFARTGSQVADVPGVEDEEMDVDQEIWEGPEEANFDPAKGISADREETRAEDELHSDSVARRRSRSKEDMVLDGGEIEEGGDGDGDITLSTPDYSQRKVIDLTERDTGEVTEEEVSSVAPTPLLSQSRSSSDGLSHAEIVRTGDSDEATLRVDLSRITASWRRLRDRLTAPPAVPSDDPRPLVEADAGVSNAEDDERAVEALSRVIDKSDFASMEVIGQFNLGFIVARRRKSVMDDCPRSADRGGNAANEPILDDLFIIDQHAADEKYNFETLQQSTKIESQKLFRPQALELTASDELLATENIDVLRQNGFEVEIDENAAPGQGSKLKLLAQPISKNTVFDMKDLEELLHLMHDRPTGHMVRCSKARAMFAMRACRKSYMVGTPLNRHQMTSVVRHMGFMDQPWHCPHGRPTMRHLFDMIGARWDRRRGERERCVDWASFGN
ncbi:hypothetical protein CERSUDRAFT_161174 [Gelatoporia subvermispora B]|uniref:DNA mismatch repair protein PMS1 n=1 Tax=Ceriporiopsis subvermispora (strain B) TaxID=914234 RepID=M2R385_CERS8|nr:hypothetical protein CERSUDRAFT_161174 [Gelatoporia subvermispora B]